VYLKSVVGVFKHRSEYRCLNTCSPSTPKNAAAPNGRQHEKISKSPPHHPGSGGERKREVGDLFDWPSGYIALSLWPCLALLNNQRVTAATALFGRQTSAGYISRAPFRKYPNTSLPPSTTTQGGDKGLRGVRPSSASRHGAVGVPASP
jgi:hypothetical protein